MAYKFQRGDAILSGGLLQEGDVEVESGFSLKIGNASMNEADLEKLDDITNGTVAASKAIVVDANKDFSGLRNATATGAITAGTSFIIGSADLNEADMEKLDGITNGTVAASKAVVVDSNKDVSGFRNVELDGALSGSGKLEIGGTVQFDGVADNAMVIADSLYYFDATDNKMKKDLASDVRDLYFSAISGDATVAAGGALTIAADAVEPSMMSIFDDSLAATDTHIMIADGSDYSSFALSGDVTMTNAGVVTIAADAVHGSMLNDDVISSQTELAADGLNAADELMISDGGTLKKIGVDNLFLDGPGLLGEAAVAVGTDYLMFLDGGATGDAKKESIADLATAFAGNGLAASSGVLAVQVSGAVKITSDKVGLTGSIAGDGLTFSGGADSIKDLSLDLSEYSTVQVASGDKFLMLDSDGATEQLETVDSLVEFMAGEALTHSGGVLSVGVDDSTIEINSDAVRLKDDGVTGAKLAPAVADLGLSQTGDGNLQLDLNELVAEQIASGDFLAFVDSSDNGTHKESVDDLAALFAGTGIKAASAVLSLDVQELSQAAVASGDFFVIEDATDNSTKKESVDDLATLFAGTGLAAASAVLSLDLNELSAAAVDVASDSIAIIDANDSNGSKKESIADLVSAMAGSGLSASGGQLSTQGSSVALKADGDTLAEGYNYFATISGSNVGVDLPAAPSVGDVVHVKAGDIQTDHVIRISTQGSHAIDGEANISLESPFAAVSLVYVVANAWRIV
jgi:hypothetical protein